MIFIIDHMARYWSIFGISALQYWLMATEFDNYVEENKTEMIYWEHLIYFLDRVHKGGWISPSFSQFGSIPPNQYPKCSEYLAHFWDGKKTFWDYTQYHLIRTTVDFLLVMVLIFSKNFTSNGPYVVLNFSNLQVF